MSISIYTYSNPYKINREPYWDSIKNCFHLCVSQTMVNGMCSQYSDFFNGKLTTISNFTNELYAEWNTPNTILEQHAAIDNAIDSIDFNKYNLSFNDENNLKDTLKTNRAGIYDSIRILFELSIKPEEVDEKLITVEQQYLLDIYRHLITIKSKAFLLKEKFTGNEINEIIKRTIENHTSDDNKQKIKDINTDTIVIHGIHQFTPIILKAIEILSNYKRVVIIYNYLQEFPNIYQTWEDVYSAFESKIVHSNLDFMPDLTQTSGGKIATAIGDVLSEDIHFVKNNSELLEVTEYSNLTEFVGYVAKEFEKAQEERIKDNCKHPVLFYMPEQIYSANSDANDILKIYFPEQFGERKFLDYPLGHFFISIINMWDPETGNVLINDQTDLLECLSCGIINEIDPGKVATVFNQTRQFFEKETDLDGIIKSLKKLKRRLSDLSVSEEIVFLKRISYLNTKEEDIDVLIKALQDVKDLAKFFYDDFNDDKNNFKDFYLKISQVLKQKIITCEELDTEFKDIIYRVLEKLKEAETITANASFDCLKNTMRNYLTQVDQNKNGAHWIVRNFEQIDGDVIRRESDKPKTYHFAELSDLDMSITKKEDFSWPLDIDFFLTAQNPPDWKYHVYVISRQEHKNFKRYAFMYGMLFTKGNIKLSYIKNKDNQNTDLYYLLKIINIGINCYQNKSEDKFLKRIEEISYNNKSYNYQYIDYLKFNLCKHKFFLESVIEEGTSYKDRFLIMQYLQVALENKAIEEYSGKFYSEKTITDFFEQKMEEIRPFAPFISDSEKNDMISSMKKYIEKYAVKKGKFNYYGAAEKEFTERRENFLTAKLNIDNLPTGVIKPKKEEELSDFIKEEIQKLKIREKTISENCDSCSEKGVCLISYMFSNNKWRTQ